MKKILSLCLSIFILMMFATGCYAEPAENIKEPINQEIIVRINSPIITANGKDMPIDEQGTVPVIVNDRTLVPIRAVVEQMGGTVSWNSEKQEVTLIYGGDEIKLIIGSADVYMNGVKRTLDAEPAVINNRAMFPIRFIAESFNFQVDWEENTQTITITNDDSDRAKDNIGGNDKVAEFNFQTKTVKLNSGYEMPLNGLGTYSLHGQTCINSVKAALQNGVRLIDTASAYGNEAEVGQAIREAIEEYGIKREEIFVTTKIYPGSEMENPEQAIQACIDRLNVGYIDLMLLHHPDKNDVKAYKAMEQFSKEGKIHSIGLSNWYIKELDEFLPQVDTVPALVQNEIHPFYQENDVIPYIQNLGIVTEGWYPFGGRGHTADILGNDVISEIAKKHGVSAAQVILRWNLQKGVVVIPGSSNPDHIKENTQLYHFELSGSEIEQINALDRNEKHDWY